MTGGIALNIIGGEWVIIIFVALVLILGTNKLPEAAKKMGKAVSEYNRARDGIREGLSKAKVNEVGLGGPAGSEREKLETMCKTLGIDFEGKPDDELQDAVKSKIGKKY